MTTDTEPHIINFTKTGDSALGYISVAEKQILPFEIKRIYWTYFTPGDVERGRHAHYELQQILVAVSGKISINTQSPSGKQETFVLDNPNTGLYIPKMVWHTMKYSHNAVQMCIASLVYDEKDYIREYETFLKKLQTTI